MRKGQRSTTLSRRRLLGLSGAVLALPAWSRLAQAASYPARPVRLVVGYAPGGATDITARVIAERLSERFGQQFFVENRPGAATNIATEQVVRSPPDGYTLLVASGANAINATLYDNLNFDFLRDITPVASVFDAVGAATGVNDAGAFVGALDDGAFVSYGGGIADLNQLLDPVSGAGWHLGAARGINNNGQIIGGGTFENDVRGFIATCVSGCGDPLTTRLNIVDVSAIPEPETYALMLAGFGMLQLALRRNRSTRSPAARHFIA